MLTAIKSLGQAQQAKSAADADLLLERALVVQVYLTQLFFISQSPYKSVNLLCILVIVKDKLTILWGGMTL